MPPPPPPLVAGGGALGRAAGGGAEGKAAGAGGLAAVEACREGGLARLRVDGRLEGLERRPRGIVTFVVVATSVF